MIPQYVYTYTSILNKRTPPRKDEKKYCRTSSARRIAHSNRPEINTKAMCYIERSASSYSNPSEISTKPRESTMSSTSVTFVRIDYQFRFDDTRMLFHKVDTDLCASFRDAYATLASCPDHRYPLRILPLLLGIGT